MTDRPIIFSAPMVRALLAGTKTQTRRVLKPQPPSWAPHVSCIFAPTALWQWSEPEQTPPRPLRRWPEDNALRLPYAPGGRLWVREAFTIGFHYDEHEMPIGEKPKPFYAASYGGMRWYDPDRDEWLDFPRWTPSIHMPRRISRLTLDVTAVRVQRLQEITEEDARAEGAYPPPAGTDDDGMHYPAGTHRDGFRALWDGLHGAGAWDANPWVVALTFTVHERNIDR